MLCGRLRATSQTCRGTLGTPLGTGIHIFGLQMRAGKLIRRPRHAVAFRSQRRLCFSKKACSFPISCSWPGKHNHPLINSFLAENSDEYDCFQTWLTLRNHC